MDVPQTNSIQCGIQLKQTPIQPFVLVFNRVKLLVHRYPLATSCTGREISNICKLCNKEDETTTHFLLQCSALSAARCEHLLPILQIFRHFRISVDPEAITKYIIDPTHIDNLSAEDNMLLEHHIRQLCYKIHVTRSVLLLSDSSSDLRTALAIPTYTF